VIDKEHGALMHGWLTRQHIFADTEDVCLAPAGFCDVQMPGFDNASELSGSQRRVE